MIALFKLSTTVVPHAPEMDTIPGVLQHTIFSIAEYLQHLLKFAIQYFQKNCSVAAILNTVFEGIMLSLHQKRNTTLPSEYVTTENVSL